MRTVKELELEALVLRAPKDWKMMNRWGSLS